MSNFSVTKATDHIVVEIPPDCTITTMKDFEQESQSWLQGNLHAIVLDFSKTKQLTSDVFPIISKFKLTTNKLGLILASININSEIASTINQSAIGGVFSMTEDLQKVKEQIAAKAKTKNILAPEIVNILLEATSFSFQNIFGSTPSRGVPFIKSENLIKGSGALSVITLTENNLIGVVRFYFFENFLQQLQKVKYQKEAKGISQKTIDDIEAFSGMYFMQVQEVLCDSGFAFQNIFPTVVTGELSQLIPARKVLSIVLPFKSSFGEFWVEIIRV